MNERQVRLIAMLLGVGYGFGLGWIACTLVHTSLR
jgi:hypothetical protein